MRHGDRAAACRKRIDGAAMSLALILVGIGPLAVTAWSPAMAEDGASARCADVDCRIAQAEKPPESNPQPAPSQPTPSQPTPSQPATPAAPASPTPAPPAEAGKPAAPAPSGAKGDAKGDDGAGIPAVVMDGKQIDSVLGKEVRSSSGEDMGRVVDILVDKAGQVRAAVIDFGGFLGVGSRQVAVDWRVLRFPASGVTSETLSVDLTKDQVRVAPVYKAGEQIVVLGRQTPPPPQTQPQPQTPPQPQAQPQSQTQPLQQGQPEPASPSSSPPQPQPPAAPQAEPPPGTPPKDASPQ